MEAEGLHEQMTSLEWRVFGKRAEKLLLPIALRARYSGKESASQMGDANRKGTLRPVTASAIATATERMTNRPSRTSKVLT
ncbi:MAG: hypothetical protein EOP84_03890 [Verrucomicrobiaceae bacterium]|nr:MAG: hypothetical protein EOP84_03890 [Verrucomicrobiaceae bacterium]